ncbi:hypothetical protein J5N97_005049 [Dioscorea zingiberensis]|uniref:Trichome birefringence-like C-terminal domain-containing protein n=1 Tax=Dioscorea zingiberensis TaxID=325984 RepID=A0A9D5D9I9_9LILI|nr:hypothetical protein J5N97_005049 [Dioscorea zingiberensis]
MLLRTRSESGNVVLLTWRVSGRRTAQVEHPLQIKEDMKVVKSKTTFTWYFPIHDATLKFFFAAFLVETTKRVKNGLEIDEHDIHLDRISTLWINILPEINYLVISSGNWFFKKIYLYEGGKLIGCISCRDKNIKNHGLVFAFRRVFRTVFQFISKCQDCKDLLTLLRTYSPPHFENGEWNKRGYCNRTQPLEDGEVQGFDWVQWEALRLIQLEKLETLRNMQSGGERKRFGVVDVTRAMMFRADGHPAYHFDSLLLRNVSDCLHWCVPGPIDMWNQLLLEILNREEYSIS